MVVQTAADDRVVEVRGLTKVFGRVRAVDDLSFRVLPGCVTGFLGPNGAGKTTTLRMVLGLVSPTAGAATVGGRLYRDLAEPARTVGAALEATGFHAGRRARDHLRVLAAVAGLPDRRVDEVLALTGIAEAGGRRVGGFSLGMRQRLALAAASASRSAAGDGVRTSVAGAPSSSASVAWRTSRPRAMITTSSTVCCTSDRTWLETRTVRPCPAR
jgi:ABC-type multidrug transport system ATPase subunit